MLDQLRTKCLVQWQQDALLQYGEQVRIKAYEEEGDGRVHDHVPLVALMLCRRSDQPFRRLVCLHRERRVPKRERNHNADHIPRHTLVVTTKRILGTVNPLCPRKLHVVRVPTVVLERHNQHVHGRQQEGGRPQHRMAVEETHANPRRKHEQEDGGELRQMVACQRQPVTTNTTRTTNAPLPTPCMRVAHLPRERALYLDLGPRKPHARQIAEGGDQQTRVVRLQPPIAIPQRMFVHYLQTIREAFVFRCILHRNVTLFRVTYIYLRSSTLSLGCSLNGRSARALHRLSHKKRPTFYMDNSRTEMAEMAEMVESVADSDDDFAVCNDASGDVDSDDDFANAVESPDEQKRKRRLDEHEEFKKSTPHNVSATSQPRLDGGSIIPEETKAQCRKREKEELRLHNEKREKEERRRQVTQKLIDGWCAVFGLSSVDDLGETAREYLDDMIALFMSEPPFVGTLSRGDGGDGGDGCHEMIKTTGAKFDRLTKTWQAPTYDVLCELLRLVPSWTPITLARFYQNSEMRTNAVALYEQTKGALATLVDPAPTKAKKARTKAHPPKSGPAQEVQTVDDATPTPSIVNEGDGDPPHADYIALVKRLRETYPEDSLRADQEPHLKLLRTYGLPKDAPLLFYDIREKKFGPRKDISMAYRLVRAFTMKIVTVGLLVGICIDLRQGNLTHEQALQQVEKSCVLPVKNKVTV